MMLRENKADGIVSGACHSTANTLRPALQLIKAKPGSRLVSAFFIMVVPDCELGYHGTFLFRQSLFSQWMYPSSRKRDCGNLGFV